MTDKDIQQVTGSILMCFIANHYLEEVKHLPIFKHSLKRSVNNTIKELQVVENKYFDKIDEIDDKQLADKLSANLISFLQVLLKGRLFHDFTTIQEILMAYELEPKKIKDTSDSILTNHNAEVVK